MKPPPLSLYVHLPWCVRKCPYCDFNSHVSATPAPFARYVDALLVDLEAAAADCQDRELISLFIGGGTPSLFPPREVARLLDAVADCLPLASDVEISMEANPGSIDGGDPAAYRAAGVNRLSIGVQSLNDRALAQLGRVHSADDARAAVRAASAAGFDNINIDLMFGLPGQTPDEALDDLGAAVALDTPHLSWYQLTIEENTVFAARPPADLPDDALLATMHEAGSALLAQRGLHAYEVSAYARGTQQCRHNLNYWQFGDYLGIGAGAHGKLSDGSRITRQVKPQHPLQYIEACERDVLASQTLTTEVDPDDVVFEFMLNAARLTAGFDESLFAARSGLPVERLATLAAPAVQRRLIGRSAAGRWQPTALGRRFLNDLQAMFLPTARRHQEKRYTQQGA